MSETWDKVKNKGAEIKGEVKNEFENIKKDFNDRDKAGDRAYERGTAQAAAGIAGTAARDTTEAVKNNIVGQKDGIPRKSDGSVDMQEAELRGVLKNQVKHLDNQEKKGYNDTLKVMRD